LTRKIAGKNQQDYARMVGLSKNIISDFERGKGDPTLSSLIKGNTIKITDCLQKIWMNSLNAGFL